MEYNFSDKTSSDIDISISVDSKPELSNQFFQSSSNVTKNDKPSKSCTNSLDEYSIFKTNPTSLYKYKKVWERALFRLRLRRALKSFKDQIVLYGTSYEMDNFFDKNYDFNEAYQNYKSKMQDRKFLDLHEVRFPRRLIHPESTFKKAWSLILALLLVYTGTIMPIRLAFFDAVYWDTWTLFDTSIDFLFIIDVILNCFSSYPKPDGTYETSHRKIIMAYLKSWMILDIIASIPFSLIEAYQISDSDENDTSYNSMIKLMKLPRLYGLLRVSRILKLVKTYKSGGMLDNVQETLGINATKARFIVFMITLTLLVHIMGCIWYFCAKLQDFSPETWVGDYGIVDEPKSTQYLSSVYWTLTTLATIGYGDITPTNDLERMACIIWMIFGVGFYTYIISSLSSLIFKLDAKRIQLTQRLYLIDQFSKESNLSSDLKIALKNAVKYSTNTTGIGLDAKFQFLSELPKELQYKMSMSLYKGAANHIPFLQNKDTSFIVYIMPLLTPHQLKDDEVIYEEGNFADEMYFIQKGRVNLILGENRLMYKSYLKGSYFGEIEIIEKIGRLDSIVTFGVCDLLALEKSYLLKLIEDYPKEGKEILQIASERRKRHTQDKKYLVDTLNKLRIEYESIRD